MSISKEHGFQLLKKVITPSTGEITVTEEIAISHLVVEIFVASPVPYGHARDLRERKVV